MNILVVAPQWPDPPRQGAAIRNLHILLRLAQRHSVTLLTFEPEGPVDKSRLKEVCAHVEILPSTERSGAQRLKTFVLSPLPDMAHRLYSPSMMGRVCDLTQSSHFDAVHIEGVEMALYGMAALKARQSRQRIEPTFLTYDAHNAEYLLQRRVLTTDLPHLRRLPRVIYSLVQWRRLRRFEKRLCMASKHIISVSTADARALGRLSPVLSNRITLLPNGVDPAYWSRESAFPPAPIPEGVQALVFDGTMDYRPNVDAVLWFASDVWPLIMKEHPQARFFIVGRTPSPEVLALSHTPGITVTGAVDDTRPWVAASTIYVVPMRMGGGVRLKVLQAMSMGCPIVSTPMGADGIDVRGGTDMLLARSAGEFARHVNSLLSDRIARLTLGNAARDRVAAFYAWPTLLPALDSIYPS